MYSAEKVRLDVHVDLSPHSPTFCQGDTLENVAKELHCILTTGSFLFHVLNTRSSGVELILEYSPSPSQQFAPLSLPTLSQPSSQEYSEVVVNMQCWNSEQISDFVLKLGFLDSEKEGGDKIKHFLHINEVCV